MCKQRSSRSTSWPCRQPLRTISGSFSHVQPQEERRTRTLEPDIAGRYEGDAPDPNDQSAMIGRRNDAVHLLALLHYGLDPREVYERLLIRLSPTSE